MQPKILFLDIETLPTVTTTFTMFPKGPLSNAGIIKHASIACAAWKWQGKKEIHAVSQLTHPGTPEHPDHGVLQELWKVLDEATAVVAHNGDRFDMAKLRGAMVVQGFRPFSPVVQIDTLKLAQKLNLESWKLDYLAEVCGLPRKIHTTYDLWHRCLAGDVSAFHELLVYNKEDVVVLEAWFDRISPWFPTLLNRALFAQDQDSADRTCPNCGRENALRAQGYIYSRAARRRNYVCGRTVPGKNWKIQEGTGCGRWSSRECPPLEKGWKNAPR